MDVIDWNCSLPLGAEHYTREALCARYYGGTPADYINKPKIIGKSADCLDYDPNAPNPDVKNAWQWKEGFDYGNNGAQYDDCSSCTACELQHDGADNAQFPVDKWHELDLTNHCPLGEFPQWCGMDSAPTSGAEDEGGTTAGPPDVLWACNGSNLLDVCLNGGEECAGGIEVTLSDLQHVVCVPSESGNDAAARQACNDACEGQNTFYDGMGDWDPEFECDKFGDLMSSEDSIDFKPFEVPSGQEYNVCATPLPSVSTKPFDGEAILDIFDGATPIATVSTSDWVGLLDFAIVGSCSSTSASCNVQIAELYAIGTEIYGDYDNGSTSVVTIQSPHFRLLQPVVGYLDPSTGVMSFPNHDFFLEVSTGPTYLGMTQVSAGVDSFIAFVDNPSGWRSSTGQVELSLAWSAGDVELSVELATW